MTRSGNAAVLFLAARDSKATKKLLADFDNIAQKTPQIRGTALAALSPDPAEGAEPAWERRPARVRLVTPLRANEAQSAVLHSSMTRRLTVATGPPGTGKSQLVANLVATAVTAGQTVLVASTNNPAVDEVWRRCDQLAPGSVVRTGSSTGATDYMYAEATTLRALLGVVEPARNTTTAEMEVNLAGDRLNRVREKFAHVALREGELRLAGEAREEHAARLDMPVLDLMKLLAPKPDLAGLGRKTARVASAKILGDWRRKRLLRGLGIQSRGDTTEACTALAKFASAENKWRAKHEQAMAAPDDEELANILDDAESAVRAASTALLDSVIRTNARAGQTRISGLLTARDARSSDWPAVKEALAAVRGWAVSSLSARRFPPDPGLFDLVIIDEASQCAIPQVLPLLFRARRALVIGDTMQLTHIAKIGSEREAMIRRRTELRSDWLEQNRLAYRRHSAFHAAKHAAGGRLLLLDEHFRCHPNIINISNRLFYDNQLTVLTDIRARPALDRSAVLWVDVTGHAARPRSGSSWVNLDEVTRVADVIGNLLNDLPAEATIGVVTPFKAQEEELQRLRRRHDPDRLRIGTVHTFQGGERDVMVFSLVAGKGMHPDAIRWIDRQPNLWNVAITRARSHLIVVGDATLWEHRGGAGSALRQAAETTAGVVSGGGDDKPDELLKRLYQVLSSRPGSTVELGTTIHGHPVDAVMRTDGCCRAVLLDPGPTDGKDAARHLRLMLRRRQLLDVEDGGGGTALRIPVWKLYSQEAGKWCTSDRVKASS